MFESLILKLHSQLPNGTCKAQQNIFRAVRKRLTTRCINQRHSGHVAQIWKMPMKTRQRSHKITQNLYIFTKHIYNNLLPKKISHKSKSVPQSRKDTALLVYFCCEHLLIGLQAITIGFAVKFYLKLFIMLNINSIIWILVERIQF